MPDGVKTPSQLPETHHLPDDDTREKDVCHVPLEATLSAGSCPVHIDSTVLAWLSICNNRID